MQSVNYLQGERSSKLLPRQVDLHCAYGCFLATPKGPYASLLTENLVKNTAKITQKYKSNFQFFFFSVSLLQFLLNHFFLKDWCSVQEEAKSPTINHLHFASVAGTHTTTIHYTQNQESGPKCKPWISNFLPSFSTTTRELFFKLQTLLCSRYFLTKEVYLN